MSEQRVAWLGLGSIGSVICQNLAANGPINGNVKIWNRTHQTALDVASSGTNMTAVESVADAVQESDIICLCLSNDEAINQVVEAIAKVDIKGKVIADMSTIHPDTAKAASAKLAPLGATYIGSTIFGGVALAVHKRITLALAGPAAAVDKFEPFTTNVTCTNIINLRDQSCEQAFLLKLVGNFMRFSAIEVLCEASVFSEKAGLSQDALQQFADVMLPGATGAQLRSLRAGDYFKTDTKIAPISMALKENEYLNDIAKKNGADNLSTLNTVTQHSKSLANMRGPEANLLGLLGVIREQNGLPFEQLEEK